MSVALYRKYRPQTFAELLDQEQVKVILEREVALNKIGHAYLFSGPRGTGKTSVARIFAKALNCVSRGQSGEPCNNCKDCNMITAGKALDILEIDAASYTGVDTVRETIIETAKFTPALLRYKVFIIDEAHMLSSAAWNALLKIMEEPPAHVIFILATTEVHKVPETILSRCQKFEFYRVAPDKIAARLTKMAQQEGLTVEASILDQIARLSEGCVRDAESILEQLCALGEQKITQQEADLVLPRGSWPLVFKLLEHLVKRDAQGGLFVVEQAMQDGLDFTQWLQELLEALRLILLLKSGGENNLKQWKDQASLEDLSSIAQKAELDFWLMSIKILLQAQSQLKGASWPQLILEIAVVEICKQGLPAKVLEPSSTSTPPSHNPAPSALPEDGNSLPTISLTEVQKQWSAILQKVQLQNQSLPLLLSSSAPLQVTGDRLIVGVRYPFHRDKLNEDKSRRLLETILSEQFVQPLRIEAVVAENISPGSQNSMQEVLEAFGGRIVQ